MTKRKLENLRDYNAAMLWQHGRMVYWTPAMRVALDIPYEEMGKDLFRELSYRSYRKPHHSRKAS